MVGLFEQWETEKNPEKRIYKKLYIDLHFNVSNKYLIPSNTARFLAPMCLRLGAFS